MKNCVAAITVLFLFACRGGATSLELLSEGGFCGSTPLGLDDLATKFSVGVRNDGDSAITQLRVGVRVECDAEAFVGQLAKDVPVGPGSKSVCGGGFEFASASDHALAPGEIATLEYQPIPPAVTQLLKDAFELARKAVACCDSTNAGCSDADLQAVSDAPGTPCGDLQAAFDRFAGPGKLSAKSASDIQMFLPYYTFTDSFRPVRGSLPPTLPLRSIVLVEGNDGAGHQVQTSTFADVLHICEGCVPSMSTCGR